MKVGIMQPYFFPYIGYWQLLNAVEKYVIYDDVNFIKGGWINRNRILIGKEPKYFNVQMVGASPYKLINEINVNNDERIIDKNLRIIEAAYKKAPYYDSAYPIIQKILKSGKENLAEYITESIKEICNYLDITTELIISSDLQKDNSLRGQEKVLTICNLLNATEYYNAVGGQELYSFSDFRQKGIELKFIKSNPIVYKQFEEEFQENLSILDVMMFNSKEQIKEYLEDYELIEDREYKVEANDGD